MPNTSVGSYFHQAANIQRNLTPQVTFHTEITLYRFPKLVDLAIGKIADSRGGVYSCCFQNLPAAGESDPENVRKTILNSFVTRQIDSCYSCQVYTPALTLPLLVFWIHANDPYDTFAANYFTLITYLFN